MHHGRTVDTRPAGPSAHDSSLTRAELVSQVRDPADVTKFERFQRSMDRRLERLGPEAGSEAVIRESMACWRNVFGVEWPATKPVGPAPRQRRPMPGANHR